MADKKRKKVPNSFTPPGIAVYPKLIEADYKFKKEGEFSTKLTLPLAHGQSIIDDIDALNQKSLAIMHEAVDGTTDKRGNEIKAFLCPDLPYLINEAACTVTFSFKMKASGETDGRAWSQRPAIVDSMGVPLDPTGMKIEGGSKLIVAYTMGTWFTEKLGAGVKLSLKAVQIITLVDKYVGDAGFTAQAPGGYVHADHQPSNEFTQPDGEEGRSEDEGSDKSAEDF